MRPDHLEVRPAGTKGEGLFVSVAVAKDVWICEYEGKHISEENVPMLPKTKKERKKYPPDVDTWTPSGNFSLFFMIDKKTHCIDANNSSGPGRKMNHSSANANVKSVVVKDSDPPRVFFKAIKPIEANEELLWDYGEKDPEIIEENPFLA